MSKAIVLVAFGSANLDGIKQSIGLLEQDLNEYFAGEYTVLKAFTSNKIMEGCDMDFLDIRTII